MKVITYDKIGEIMQVLGFEHEGIIYENDIDSINFDTDYNNRKRRDAEILTTFARNSHNNILEIGTSTGRSSYRFATNAPTNCNIFTVDISKHKNIGSYSKGIRSIKQYFADSRTWKVPKEVNSLTFTYIDGDHSTQSVYSDSWLALNQNSKYILWHDFSPDNRSKFKWIDDVMSGVEKFLLSINFHGHIYHLKNSWIGIMKVESIC